MGDVDEFLDTTAQFYCANCFKKIELGSCIWNGARSPDKCSQPRQCWASIPYVGSGGRAVERRTVNRGDGGSIPFRNLGNFFTPHLPVSFGRDTKSRWSLLSGVYGGKCVTCSGLTNSREEQLLR